MARGDFVSARTHLEAALRADAGQPEAVIRERLAVVCSALEDFEAGQVHAGAAFRMWREAGEPQRAAFVAITLGRQHWALGDEAAARGWLARGARLLDGEGPCLERGYLAVAIAACDVHDLDALRRDTEMALELARRYGDTDLETRALADSGLAMVALGHVAEGIARLDEAMTAVVSGEVRNHSMAGLTCCAMLHACDRINDVERAAEWTRAVTDHARAAFGDPPPNVLLSHCRIAFGAMLVEVGRWDEAEAELCRARGTSRVVVKRAEASGRLAEILVRRGRCSEAEEILRGHEDSHYTAQARARLCMARDQPRLAEATLLQALRELEGDLPMTLRLHALRTEVLLQTQDVPGAARSATEAQQAAERLGRPGLVATGLLAAGRASAAAGDADTARGHLEEAIRAVTAVDRPVLRAEARLELAEVLSAADPAGAVAQARAAVATLERLGIRRETDRCAALLRRLGAPTRATGPAGPGPAELSRREREVFALLGEGLSNAEIGRRLFITTRTAEHHVAAVLDKLGMRRRAEAAAYAVAQRPAP